MKCIKCGYQSDEEIIFCPECGTKIPEYVEEPLSDNEMPINEATPSLFTCPQCDHLIEDIQNAAFCPNCGNNLKLAVAPITSPASQTQVSNSQATSTPVTDPQQVVSPLRTSQASTSWSDVLPVSTPKSTSSQVTNPQPVVSPVSIPQATSPQVTNSQPAVSPVCIPQATIPQVSNPQPVTSPVNTPQAAIAKEVRTAPVTNKKSLLLPVLIPVLFVAICIGGYFLVKGVNSSNPDNAKNTEYSFNFSNHDDTKSTDGNTDSDIPMNDSADSADAKRLINQLKGLFSRAEKETSATPDTIAPVYETETEDANIDDQYNEQDFDVEDFDVEDSEIPFDATDSTEELTYRHEYQFYQMDVTWEEAQEYCNSLGGHLATITTEEEQLYIESNLDTSTTQAVILGATNYTISGDFEWLTNEEFTYSKWMEGEPNNDGDVEHFLYLYYVENKGGWVWNDAPNDLLDYYSGKIWFVCEWEYEE